MVETLDLLGTVSTLGGLDQRGTRLRSGHRIAARGGQPQQVVLLSYYVCELLPPHGVGIRAAPLNWSLAECERDLAEALHLAREMEWAAGEAFTDIYFGGILASFGRLGAGLAYAQQGLRLATEIDHQQWIACRA